MRRAELSDADAVGQLLHDFNTEFDEPTPGSRALAECVGELLAGGETKIILGGPGPDGVAVLRFRPAIWTRALECYLAELYVAPERRGQGLGRAMVEAAVGSLAPRSSPRGLAAQSTSPAFPPRLTTLAQRDLRRVNPRTSCTLGRGVTVPLRSADGSPSGHEFAHQLFSPPFGDRGVGRSPLAAVDDHVVAVGRGLGTFLAG